MHYRLGISDSAKRALRLISKQDRQEIGYKIYLMQEDLSGDVKKLRGSQNEYRLRVGNYRVKFRLENDLIAVYKIGDRKDIYR
jgi:mRNA interferase RelE/StbE